MHFDKYDTYQNGIFTFYEYIKYCLQLMHGLQVNVFLDGLLALELNASLTTPVDHAECFEKILFECYIPARSVVPSIICEMLHCILKYIVSSVIALKKGFI